MANTPFMQLYVGDYLADTLDLTTEQHGAYLLLLMTMWRAGGSLPNDPAKLARIARVHPPRWGKVWAEIARFFVVDSDRITNQRLSKEHEKALLKSRSRSEAGSLGGRAKALKSKEPALANATAMLKHSSESEEKRDTNVSPKKNLRGSRLKSDWQLPKAWGDEAVGKGLPPDVVRREAEKFRNYWIAKAGKEAVKLDWQATWRNWIAKRIEDRPTAAVGGEDFWTGPRLS